MGRASTRALAAFLTVYTVVLLGLLTRLSLWLDEIIDLRQIRDSNPARLIAQVPLNAGGVPLSYLVRAASIHLLGYSVFSARLPSLVFSVLAALGIYVLARQVRLRYPLLPVVIFCLFPIQIRYALESRPYSQALAIAAWTTVAFLYMQNRPTFSRASLYTLLVLAGLYMQPYTIFVPLAHLLWSLRNKRVAIFTLISIALASLAFLPWQLWVVHLWRSSAASQQHYVVEPRSSLMIAKELVGAGYLGTLVTVLFALLALRPNGIRYRQLWVLFAACSLFLPVLADVLFNYFLATRQLITVLIPLALLSAAGLEQLWLRNARFAATVCTAFALILLAGTIQFFRRPRENWQTASAQLKLVANRGGCLVFAPASSETLYTFFVPDLSGHSCPADSLAGHAPVALAKSPYGSSADYAQDLQQLAVAGYRQIRELNGQEPKVYLFAPTRK